jgi:Arc/MetJ-type ribon-helix-helix transcriptional regulator
MIRTVVSLPEEDKRWLDDEAVREGVSMTEVIRRAVSRLRAEARRAKAFDDLLKTTAGIGTGDDGVALQKKLRKEWDGRTA